jgi:hypothetical protein
MTQDIATSNSLADLAARIREEHGLVIESLKRGLEHAIRAGDLLREAKAQLAHGEWLPWLDQCDISDRTARHYMRLSRYAPELKSANFADLTITDAVHAIEKPKPAIDSTAIGIAPYLPRDGQVRVGALDLWARAHL